MPFLKNQHHRMFAFVNDRASCFMDTVIVAMFAGTTAFDAMLNVDNDVAVALRHEVHQLRNNAPRGWVITTLRQLMGGVWNNGEPQSAVDFLQALLKLLGVVRFGRLRHMIAYIPRNRTATPDIRWSSDEDFSIHLAVAGQHASLVDIFNLTETVLPDDADSFATVQGIVLTEAPVLIFEVGRNASTALMSYGSTISATNAIAIAIDKVQYVLVSIVCRVGSHYMGFIWNSVAWGLYDDAHAGGLITAVHHPEQTHCAPSRYGELFFYIKQDV
jgi:hypothetical protein